VSSLGVKRKTPAPPGKRHNGSCLPPRESGFWGRRSENEQNYINSHCPSLSLEVFHIYYAGSLHISSSQSRVVSERGQRPPRGKGDADPGVSPLNLPLYQPRPSFCPLEWCPNRNVVVPMVYSSSRAGSMLRSDDDGHNCLWVHQLEWYSYCVGWISKIIPSVY